MNQNVLNQTIQREFRPKEDYKTIYQKLFSYVESLKFEDPYSSYFERNMMVRFLHSFALQGVVLFEDIKLLSYGLELKKERDFFDLITPDSQNILNPNEIGSLTQNKKVEIEVDGLKFDLYILVDSIHYRNFIIAWIFPINLNPNLQEMLSLYNFAKTFFIYGYFQQKPQNTLNAFPDLLYYIRNSINNSPHKDGKIQGTLSHFHIQDLKAYYKVLGEKITRQMLDSIKNEIKKYIKAGDLYYRVGQMSYLTYSPNFNVDQARERYKWVFFKTHEIMIEFKLYFYVVDGPLLGGEDFWEALLPNT
ncbi:MAG: hypothetical protein H7A23_01840 [Leptospiraceae bacterium]|nr:hypothetical protein [Leptospiraceae bacterium]MCP5493274.1 hypothetical protein [Leptospiraceae bacterium]